MSNLKLIIPERAANIGNFMVGRLLPFREKRAVGPFVFIDHMGPITLPPNQNFDVLPHPHIGLSTLTYLFEGTILHRDSLGTEIEISPGAINWMTAGKGVVHSERTPKRFRNIEKRLHGLQIWVALPKHLEQITPWFTHIDETNIPKWQNMGLHFTLIAGEFMGKKSPVPVYSKLYFVEIKNEAETTVNLNNYLFGETGLYILQGEIVNDENVYEAKQILVLHNKAICSFTMKKNTTIYVFGGDSFAEERFIYWNFVSSDKKIIEKAVDDWKNKNFPKINGETEFVPIP